MPGLFFLCLTFGVEFATKSFRMKYLFFFIFFSSFAFGFSDDGFGSGGDEREAVQTVVNQTKTAGRNKAQTYYVKEKAGAVYMYNGPRGAVRRMMQDDGGVMTEDNFGGSGFKETYVEKKLSPGQKIKFVPLECGIGVIRRKKYKHSYYYVILSQFESEEERNARINEANKPEPETLKLGTAICKKEAIVFYYQSDYRTYQQLRAQADDDAISGWCTAQARRGNAYIANEGEKVIIVEVDGNLAKVLHKDRTAWMSASSLKNKK